MFFISIIVLINLIPSMQSSALTLNLTFAPDEKYYEMGHTVDVYCDFNIPNDKNDPPQLWHVDFKTGKRSPISRAFIQNPPDDAPEAFKHNKDKRIQYLRKNYLRISNLQLEDSARYECDCPDCEENIATKTHKLQVMKLAEPKWHIEPGWPVQEKAKITIKCTADDFYPYVEHKIINNHHEISKDGKHVHIPQGDVFPHKFSWETIIEPTQQSHNTTLVCTVKQGVHERHARKVLEVLFTPRFQECSSAQHVDPTKDKASIVCSFAGNPAPQLVWYRQIDNQPITTDSNFVVTTESENHGKYKSILTFDRMKLAAVPTTTTTKSPADSSTQTPIKGTNYYEQLLNSGFVAKLILNNEEKDSKKITIVGEASKAKVNGLDNSSRQTLSASILVLFASDRKSVV